MEFNDELVLTIALGLRDAGHSATAERLELPMTAKRWCSPSTSPNATRSCKCSSTCGLCELRPVLFKQQEWRVREGS